jgi:hypothetical protein
VPKQQTLTKTELKEQKKRRKAKENEQLQRQAAK